MADNINTSELLVIHHSPCSDGSTAAAVMSLLVSDHTSIGLLGTTYGKYTLTEENGSIVFESYNKRYRITGHTELMILDFSFKKEEIMLVSKYCKSLTILDHHSTAQQDLAGEFPENVSITFDMNRSGAMLAWDYVFPGLPYSRMVELVGMRDLWKHKGTPDQQDAEALQLSITSSKHKFNAKHLNKYVTGGPKFDEFLEEGRALLRFFDSQIKEAMSNANVVYLEPDELGRSKSVAVVNSSGVLASELGNRLCEAGNDFSAVWNLDSTGDVRCSMRSIGDNDCIRIARHFGGGGHKNAAGFRASLYEFLDYFGMLNILKF